MGRTNGGVIEKTVFMYSINMQSLPQTKRGRAAVSNRSSRFLKAAVEAIDDGWSGAEGEAPDQDSPPKIKTALAVDSSRGVLSFNQSPDVPFDRSVNPFKGCEHGCIYCFARPGHAYLDLSPGLDFETRLFHKPDAPRLLAQALAKRGYQPATLAIGVSTDCYQPIERDLKTTRQLLELMLETRHPCSIITKSALIERDLDLLSALAEQNLVNVGISLTTLDKALARRMEPRATAPHRRLETISRLSEAGVPVYAMLAPLVPVLTDPEMETLLWAAKQHGAEAAGYILLRLPHEVAPLFREWLEAHYPGKAEHVMNRMRDCRGGRDYNSEFSQRMQGTGPFAELIKRRFELACERLELKPRWRPLRTDLFRKPGADGAQMSLF